MIFMLEILVEETRLMSWSRENLSSESLTRSVTNKSGQLQKRVKIVRSLQFQI